MKYIEIEIEIDAVHVAGWKKVQISETEISEEMWYVNIRDNKYFMQYNTTVIFYLVPGTRHYILDLINLFLGNYSPLILSTSYFLLPTNEVY